jgi:hypothetical protein
MPTIRLLLVVGLLLGVGCASEPPSSSGPSANEAAPDFTVETFDDGTFALAEHDGGIVVLNFFESW